MSVDDHQFGAVGGVSVNPRGDMAVGSLTYPISARDTIRQERTWVGKTPITRYSQLPKLVGKKYFVSRTISGANFRDERS